MTNDWLPNVRLSNHSFHGRTAVTYVTLILAWGPIHFRIWIRSKMDRTFLRIQSANDTGVPHGSQPIFKCLKIEPECIDWQASIPSQRGRKSGPHSEGKQLVTRTFGLGRSQAMIVHNPLMVMRISSLWCSIWNEHSCHTRSKHNHLLPRNPTGRVCALYGQRKCPYRRNVFWQEVMPTSSKLLHFYFRARCYQPLAPRQTHSERNNWENTSFEIKSSWHTK